MSTTRTTREATVDGQRWLFDVTNDTATLAEGELVPSNAKRRELKLSGDNNRRWLLDPARGKGHRITEEYMTNGYTTHTHNDNNSGYRTRLAGWCWGQWGRHPVLGVLGVVGGLAYLVKLLFDVLGGVIGGLLGSVSFGWLGGLVSVTGFLILVIAGLVGFIIWDRRHPSQRRR